MKKYGLIGYPLTHSFSKRYFTDKFQKEKIDSSYENFEIDSITKFPAVLESNPGVIGFNVTIPYKEQIISYLNELDEASKKIGAVNTIKVTRNESALVLKGFNTDTFGFKKSIQPLLKREHKNALILGTGGASKAVKYVFDELGITHLSVTRRPPGAREINYADLNEKIMGNYLVIVNTTPLGTYPNTDSFPDLPYEFVGEKHLFFDLVYNPEVTQFLAKGAQQGASIKNGYDMLLGQAIKSYEIWNKE